MLIYSFFIFYIYNLFISQSSQLQYSNQILPLKTFEKLDYSDFKFESVDTNLRKRRETSNSIDDLVFETNRLKFSAFGREFDIYLRRDLDLVADNVDIEVTYATTNKPSDHLKDFFTSNYYTGFVDGESRSHVICYFEKNDNNISIPLIYSQIQIQNDNENVIYYIEPLIQKNENKNKYIVYRVSDIESDILSNNIFNKTVCKPKYYPNEHVSKELNSETNDSRVKRNAKTKNAQANQKTRKNRCYLALVADHRFFKEIGNSNVKLTTAYLINIIGAVNAIFTRTAWNLNPNYEQNQQDQITDTDPDSTNYGFTVEKVIVHSEPTQSPHHYNSLNSSTDADTILQKFGEEDWSSYCLAHLFTFQSFENSVLGLAYVSSPLSYTLGGICSPTTRSMQMSVNTGLSSYKSVSQQQVRLLQREAELVTAHEFGHNWGSEHDPLKPECTPSSSNGGNFIMYAYSNQGHERNNFYFSPCSINSISEVLKTKATCFKGESLSYCGNDRIEGEEECDAGLNGRQGLDKCCDYNCKLKPNAECSDSNHYCCNQCKIAPKGRKCYSSYNYIECFEDHSYCDGFSKDCPTQKPKPVNTPCNSYDSGKCNANGQCMSLCQQMDKSYMSCQCIEQQKRCQQCCKSIFLNGTSVCRPLHETFPNVYFSPIYLSNGRACHQGLCENRVCQQKVKDYVGRLWKVIQKVTVSGFVEFMKRNIVGSIIIISLSIWVPMSCCIHFCIDKRNRQMQKQKIYQMKVERMNSNQSYMRLTTDEQPRITQRTNINNYNVQYNDSSL